MEWRLEQFGHCLFLIPSPTDDVVYGCFRSLAQRWRAHVRGERLWIEGDVPIGACLTAAAPSSALAKVLDVHSDVIARIDLDFEGLTFSYLRSGGHGPVMFRKSFFDEVRIELESSTPVQEHDINEMFRELCTALDACIGTATPTLMPLLEQLQLNPAPEFRKST